jgi:GNAT superfamily N-acetyltransferase
MIESETLRRNTQFELGAEKAELTTVTRSMWSSLQAGILKIEDESFPSALADSERDLFELVNSPTGIFLALTFPSPCRVIGYIAADLLENFPDIPGTSSDSHFERRDTIYVASVAVLPDWRRRGLGTALMRECLRVASERGIERATAHIETGSVGRMGLAMKVLKSFRDWYGTGCTFDYVEILVGA